MTDNPVAQALAAAARHPKDAAVTVLADKLRLAQRMLVAQETPPFDQLAGYRRGAAGEDGFGMMLSIDVTGFRSVMQDMSTLREIAVVTECLIAVLGTRGEEIRW